MKLQWNLRVWRRAAASQWDNLRAVAHKMKSTMQFLGLEDTLETVKFIEVSARERTHLEQIPEKSVQLCKFVPGAGGCRKK